jgi:hypothetical protein
MEAEGLLAIGGNVTMVPAGMASAVTFAVSGFMVAPSVGLAIAILFRRGRWWFHGCVRREEFCIGMEGLVGLRFISVVVPVLPYYLYDQPFKGIGLPKVSHHFFLEVFDLIELLIGLLNSFVEVGSFVP